IMQGGCPQRSSANLKRAATMCASMLVVTAVIKQSRLRCMTGSAFTSAQANRVKTDKQPVTDRDLIFLRLELGKFLFGAGNVGFPGAAKSEKFFLATDIGFSRIELSLLAFDGRGMRCFNRER